jgi:hypothetical protein
MYNNDNINIVTIATESKYYLPYLTDTIKKNNGNIKILGYGEEWQGFSWRYELMINYLKTLPSEEVVCFVDGYDVICTRDLLELKPVYLELKNKHNCKIIVSHHKIKQSIPYKITNTLYFGTCNKELINAGTYIGNAGDLLTIIQNIFNLSKNNASDDQILMTKYCKKNPTDFYIDIENEIFFVLDSPYKEIKNDVIIENKMIKTKYNQTSPFFIHGPGATYLDSILIELGYKDINVKEELYNDYYKKLCMYIHPSIYKFYTKHTKNIKSDYYEIKKYIILLIIILIFVIILLVFFIYYFKKTKRTKRTNMKIKK